MRRRCRHSAVAIVLTVAAEAVTAAARAAHATAPVDASAIVEEADSSASGYDGSAGGRQKLRLPCEEPVRRAPVAFPDHLVIGDAADGLSMYSGYVNVTSTDYLFYWFVEADVGAPLDAPLVVWTNGGPGCSSMEGITTEHGPLVLFGIKEDSGVSPSKLSRNPYAWNREAHVLYVDQPRYVGFSCGTGPFVTSSVDAGRDMVEFIRGWRGIFPEHARREVILGAESYGGHFVPAWSSAILDYNAAGVADPIRLTGMIIGNGIVNDSVQGRTFPEFARREGLIPKNITVQSSWGAREIMKNFVGYEPNYYDYRLVEQGCCGCSAYNYRPWSEFLMREDVTKALHACGDSGAKAFGGCAAGCIQLPSFDENDVFSYSGALGRALDQGVQLTLYYGMQDTACNWVGGYEMAKALEWRGQGSFAAARQEDFVIGGISIGSIKAARGLTWIQIEGAGHMVPINNPSAAYYALGTLIRTRRWHPTKTVPGLQGPSTISRWLFEPAGSPFEHASSAGYASGSVALFFLGGVFVLAAGLAIGLLSASFRRRPASMGYQCGTAQLGEVSLRRW